MVPFQISYEAPALWVMFHAYFQDKNFDKLKVAAVNKKTGLSEDNFKSFMGYVAAFYQYMGNYHSFGSKKFIPELSTKQFKAILESNPLFNKNTEKGRLYKHVIHKLYPQVEREIFNNKKPYTQLGYPSEDAVTSYFSSNMDKKDLKLVQEFLQTKDISPLNTRAFKTNSTNFIISIGSIDTSKNQQGLAFSNHTFELRYGEFAEYLKDVNYFLEKALPFAANEHETKMVELYIKHFKSGDINDHKDSQREWIKDKGPVIESNIGWIEHYVDPSNLRAIF